MPAYCAGISRMSAVLHRKPAPLGGIHPRVRRSGGEGTHTEHLTEARRIRNLTYPLWPKIRPRVQPTRAVQLPLEHPGARRTLDMALPRTFYTTIVLGITKTKTLRPSVSKGKTNEQSAMRRHKVELKTYRPDSA